MKKPHLGRPSASLVISCLALFVALGGTVYASSTIDGTTVRKNSMPGNRIENKTLPGNRVMQASEPGDRLKADSVTGTQINEATLGEVTSAASATNVNSVKTFSAGANAEAMVSLVKTANFELMGICDPNEEFDPPGVQYENSGTAFVIYNRSAVPAFADSEDDENAGLLQNEGVVFNYDDNGDGGEAMSTDGHFLAAPSWANMQADIEDTENPAEHSYPFSTTCHFAGAALVG
jgi:hypothetical protein